VKISIALATYNGSQYLTEQLQSYLDQDRMPDELVISDDCSTDGTCNLIDRFSERAPFDVRVIRQPIQRGYVANFDCALSMATGDLIFLSDQDDVWLPQKISEVCDFIEKNPDFLLVLNDAEITKNDLSRTGLTKLGQLRSAGSPDSAFVMGCCCAIRRELLDLSLPIPEGAKGHDNWLVDFSNGLSARFVLESVLQLYRRHDSNQSLVIANSLRRTHFIDRLKWQLARALSKDADEYAEREIGYLEQLHLACHRARGRCDGKYDIKIRHYEEQLDRKINFLHVRRELRGKAMHIRLINASRLWLSGAYGQANGLKSVIRDLIG
jgi:glycosyltransferase involved in cell wall biosynthesis